MKPISGLNQSDHNDENTPLPSSIEETLPEQPLSEKPATSEDPGPEQENTVPPPPDFLRPPIEVKPVPPPSGQPRCPPMDEQPPHPYPGVWAGRKPPDEDRQSRMGSPLAVLVIIATVIILGCLSLFVIFDLLGLRSFLTKTPAPSLPPESFPSQQMPSELPPSYNPCPWSEPSSPPSDELPQDGDFVIDPVFEQVGDFDENGLAPVYDGLGWGLIDWEGNQVLECAFDHIFEFSQGYAVVELQELYGLVTTFGEFAVQPEWENAFYYSQGLLPVSRDGKYGFIDLSGNEVIPLQYDDAYSFEEGYAAVTLGKSSFFINDQGHTVSPVYQEAFSFSDGLAPVCQNGAWGYVDSSFELVIPCLYDSAGFFTQGYAVVIKNSRSMVIDAAGNQVSPPADQIWLQESGYALLEINGFLGLYDLVEEGYLITPQYRNAFLFSEGLMPVTPDGSAWYYVDEDNRPAVPGEYEFALPFREGVAPVMLDGYYGLIDRDGNVILDFIWDSIGPCKNGMVAVETDGLYGFIKLHGK